MALAHCEVEGERWAKNGAVMEHQALKTARKKLKWRDFLTGSCPNIETAEGFGALRAGNVEMAEGFGVFGGAAAWTGFKRTEANKGNEGWNTQKITWNRWNYAGF